MIPVVFLSLWLSGELEMLTAKIAESGRVLTIDSYRTPPEKLALGVPPLLSFRLLDGKQAHRFAELDLVMDDAGH